PTSSRIAIKSERDELPANRGRIRSLRKRCREGHRPAVGTRGRRNSEGRGRMQLLTVTVVPVVALVKLLSPTQVYVMVWLPPVSKCVSMVMGPKFPWLPLSVGLATVVPSTAMVIVSPAGAVSVEPDPPLLSLPERLMVGVPQSMVWEVVRPLNIAVALLIV